MAEEEQKAADEAKRKPEIEQRRKRLRTDLLSPSEAWMECCRRMANVLPDIPALILVTIFGGCGAWLARACTIQVTGESKLLVYIYTNHSGLLPWMGVTGAVAAVFLLAKTDTSKLIHCSLIALFSGMAGPYLVIQALSTVVHLDPKTSPDTAAAVDSANQAETNAQQLKQASSDTANPSSLFQKIDETTDSTTRYLSLLKNITKADPDQREKLLSQTQESLTNALDNLGSAAPQSPRKVFSALSEVAAAAQDAGADRIAYQAQQIIDKAKTSPEKAVQQAAIDSAPHNASQLYFITPPELTDNSLFYFRNEIQQQFPGWIIQPAVHPVRTIDDGIEVVYYNSADKANAALLGQRAKDYFQAKNVLIRQGSVETTGVQPSQFDLHIGPDIAKTSLLPHSSPSPNPSQASPAPSSRPETTPIKPKRKRLR